MGRKPPIIYRYFISFRERPNSPSSCIKDGCLFDSCSRAWLAIFLDDRADEFTVPKVSSSEPHASQIKVGLSAKFLFPDTTYIWKLIVEF